MGDILRLAGVETGQLRRKVTVLHHPQRGEYHRYAERDEAILVFPGSLVAHTEELLDSTEAVNVVAGSAGTAGYGGG